MYIRTTRRVNKDGSVVEYVQLAHNYRDPESGRPKPEILFNLGRRDQLDLDVLRRLTDSIQRFIGPADGPAAPNRSFLESRPMGGAWLLRGLWDQLEIGATLEAIAAKQGLSDPVGVVGCIWAMVANRALEPMSKHAAVDWLAGGAFVPETPEGLYDERLYRAMDFLLAAGDTLQEAVFFRAADLLSLEVDLLLYDTTSVYCEMEGDDRDLATRAQAAAAQDGATVTSPSRHAPQVVNEPPLRLRGHSKDHREDLAQIVVGLAVTRQGIPVRAWVWPGNTNDATTIAEVKASLAGWRLNRVVWAVDRGMTSEDNLRILQQGGAHYIAGEKMRSGNAEALAALARPGRYRVVDDKLEVKEVFVGEGAGRRRYVIVRNPRQAERDRAEREAQLQLITDALARLPEDRDGHTKAVCALVAHRSLGRYLKTDARGRPSLDKAKVKAETRLDGKYLVRTSDEQLSATDIALGYKQLGEVERAWRCLKTHLDLRPMYHRKAERIRAHVLVCWLALFLVRVAEVRSDHTWLQIRRELNKLHRGVFAGPAGRVVQTTELTAKQRQLFQAAKVLPPRRIEAIHPASTEVQASSTG